MRLKSCGPACLLVAALAVALPVAAQQAAQENDTLDSLIKECEHEARDVGVTDREEIAEYVAECIEDTRRLAEEGDSAPVETIPTEIPTE